MTDSLELHPVRRLAGAWFEVLGAPLAWALQLDVVYALSSWACGTGRAVLHVTTVVCLAIAVAGGLLALRRWRETGRVLTTQGEPPEARDRFMALLGLLTSSLFTLAILAAWVVVAVLNPCPQ